LAEGNRADWSMEAQGGEKQNEKGRKPLVSQWAVDPVRLFPWGLGELKCKKRTQVRGRLCGGRKGGVRLRKMQRGEGKKNQTCVRDKLTKQLRGEKKYTQRRGGGLIPRGIWGRMSVLVSNRVTQRDEALGVGCSTTNEDAFFLDLAKNHCHQQRGGRPTKYKRWPRHRIPRGVEEREQQLGKKQGGKKNVKKKTLLKRCPCGIVQKKANTEVGLDQRIFTPQGEKKSRQGLSARGKPTFWKYPGIKRREREMGEQRGSTEEGSALGVVEVWGGREKKAVEEDWAQVIKRTKKKKKGVWATTLVS